MKIVVIERRKGKNIIRWSNVLFLFLFIALAMGVGLNALSVLFTGEPSTFAFLYGMFLGGGIVAGGLIAALARTTKEEDNDKSR